MARGAGKNGWALFLLILAGVVLGSFISQLTSGVAGLSWLNFGKSFGLAKPLTLNLGVLVLTFGLLPLLFTTLSRILSFPLFQIGKRYHLCVSK